VSGRRALAVAAVAAALWLGRRGILTGLGAALVAEDPPGPADVAVVSEARVVPGTLEAARLYAAGRVRAVLVPGWAEQRFEREVRALGIAYPTPAELAREVLLRSGVPADAIVTFGTGIDGTNTEIALIGRYVAARHPASVLYLTARSHTARARWLLRRTVPPGTRVAVRSPEGDTFHAAGWWHDRGQAREVAAEYARWFNSLVLGDWWRARPGAHA
jgi:uncharacterized SAM-binding protein YcdF (DUF218 family)